MGLAANFICGRRFQLVSDFVRDTNKTFNYGDLKNKSVIWCKTDFVRELFMGVRKHDKPYILITHNSDYAITKELFNLRPGCIKKWFAQNVDFLHPDLIPLPIGLENDLGPSKGLYTDYTVLERSFPNTKNTNLVYCNFNLDHQAARKRILDLLTSKGVAFVDKRFDYATYCSNMSNYLFVASPRGNGIDCHRTWEALYLGSIPIVEKHLMYNCYRDLPIIQIECWEDVDKEWLEEQSKSLNKNIDYSQLELVYWFNKIKKEKENL